MGTLSIPLTTIEQTAMETRLGEFGQVKAAAEKKLAECQAAVLEMATAVARAHNLDLGKKWKAVPTPDKKHIAAIEWEADESPSEAAKPA